MNLADYFENTDGLGILATADAECRVNLALYTAPHVFDNQTIAFVMRDRLTHKNLQARPYGAFMYIENCSALSGIRLHLTKLSDEKNSSIIDTLKRQNPKIYPESLDDSDKYLVRFWVEKIRPLVGDKTGEQTTIFEDTLSELFQGSFEKERL